MCPRISEEFLAEEKRNMGEWWYAQEYGCVFSLIVRANWKSVRERRDHYM